MAIPEDDSDLLTRNALKIPEICTSLSCFDPSCPALRCSKNKLAGLLRHVRESHGPNQVPGWFIRKHGIQQCPSCLKYFKDLKKHSGCKGPAQIRDFKGVRQNVQELNGDRSSLLIDNAVIQTSIPINGPEEEAWNLVDKKTWDQFLTHGART